MGLLSDPDCDKGSPMSMVCGPGLRPPRDRSADRGVRVGRAGRLPAVRPLQAGGASHRSGRGRGLLQPPPRRGYLCRRGPPTLRWALFEAGKAAARPTSPDYDYYQADKQAHDGKPAAIAMASKLARRCYHTLRAIDPNVVYAMLTA